MNGCEHINDLGPYLDGELDPPHRLALEAHLSGCAACRAELAQLRALSGVLAEARQPVLPARALWRLHGQVNGWMEDAARAEREAERAERGVLRITRILTGIAACVLVAGSLWLVQSRQTVSPPRATFSRTVESWEGAALNGTATGDSEAVSSASGASGTSSGDGAAELLVGGLVNPTASAGWNGWNGSSGSSGSNALSEPAGSSNPSSPGASGNEGAE